MTDRPMIFTTESVRAILSGRKTQTRRIIKYLAPHDTVDSISGNIAIIKSHISSELYSYTLYKCPYGRPGDGLWIREAWRPCQVPQCGDSQCVEYRATERCRAGHLATLNRTGWRSPWFLPRRLARATRLPIVEIRVERLQSISEDDAKAEGVDAWFDHRYATSYTPAMSYRKTYQALWDKINGKKAPWISNPWVWVVEFKV